MQQARRLAISFIDNLLEKVEAYRPLALIRYYSDGEKPHLGGSLKLDDYEQEDKYLQIVLKRLRQARDEVMQTQLFSDQNE